MSEHQEYERWRRALASESLPAGVVDLDAVDANLRTLLAVPIRSDVTIRVASKSLRVPWLMRYLLELGGDRLRGLMTYSARECELLAEQGFDDLLMGYPFARPDEARALARLAAAGKTAIATVDAPEQLDLLAAAAREVGANIPVCIDVDVSLRLAGGRIHLGVRRSPIRGPQEALALAKRIADSPRLELVALLAYEAQVAGLPDRSRVARHLDPMKRLIKARSIPFARTRRGEIVAALADAGHDLEVVNGGGTGSLASTGLDRSVTEVTVGSGFLCSHLFDGYHGLELRPSVFFALSVVRRSDRDHLTCAGGGFLASGPAAPDRAPLVHLPPGLEPLAMEGFGEVQTPLRLTSEAPQLALGDPVLCRHAKAGELAERFAEYVLVRGDEVVGREPTYRGLGARFT